MAEAIAKVQALKARGIRNIDVGCMQINMQYHPDGFPDLETALEPESNIAYAAKYLRSLFDDSKSWIAAVGNYHSATPEYHFRYRAKITELWASCAAKAPKSTGWTSPTPIRSAAAVAYGLSSPLWERPFFEPP